MIKAFLFLQQNQFFAMVNYNGSVISESEFSLSMNNRAFKYGDGIFDTLKYQGGKIQFLEDHYFRLMSSMRMLRMKIPIYFTMEYYKVEIEKLFHHVTADREVRIRVNVFRGEGGLYAPETNQINYLIEVNDVKREDVETYEVELFKDYPVASGILSTVKTNNRMINVLAGIYAEENNYDNCLLINEKKELVEAINANVFLLKGNQVLTPSLKTGCVNGIIRKKLIEMLQGSTEFVVVEEAFSPFELLKADELFLTNSISEFTMVDQYRKKIFKRELSEKIAAKFSHYYQQ